MTVSESAFARTTRQCVTDSLVSLNRGLLGRSARVVCFGMGCIGNSHIAQHQTGLLLLFREWLQAEGFTVDSVEVYDPILCEKEKEAFQLLGHKLIILLLKQEIA